MRSVYREKRKNMTKEELLAKLADIEAEEKEDRDYEQLCKRHEIQDEELHQARLEREIAVRDAARSIQRYMNAMAEKIESAANMNMSFEFEADVKPNGDPEKSTDSNDITYGF